MWLLLLGWLIICGICILLYHFCAIHKTKGRRRGVHTLTLLELEKAEKWRATTATNTLQTSHNISWTGGDRILLNSSENRSSTTLSQHDVDGSGSGSGMELLARGTGNSEQPITLVEEESFPTRQGHQQQLNFAADFPANFPPNEFSAAGIGPFRFTVPTSIIGNNNGNDVVATTASTSHCSSSKEPDVSNSALATFFSQLLTNLGVNLRNGNTLIFAEQDHDIVWLNIARGASEGLFAVHPKNLDDKVTELLERFTELFVTEGLLPYELERMPRTAVSPGMLERRLNCNICLQQFNAGENATKLECQHLYHSECIHAWLLTRNTCPTCRYAVFFDDPNKAMKKIAGIFV